MGIGLIVAALLLVSRSLTAFYVASIVAEATALAVLLSHAFRGRDLIGPGSSPSRSTCRWSATEYR